MKGKLNWLLMVMIVLAAVFPALGQEKPQQLLFTNANIFDGVKNALLENASVLVEGNLIKIVTTETIDAPGAIVIDCGGRTLMPGLIDSHVHLNMLIEGGLKEIEAARWDQIGAVAAGSAQEWLMEGFTTVRGMGGMGNGHGLAIVPVEEDRIN